MAFFVGFLVLPSQAQDSLRTNPVLFGDFFLGGATGKMGGFASGLGLYRQHKQHLFSGKYLGLINWSVDFPGMPFVPLPLVKASNTVEELSLLYGLRLTEGPVSVSLSAGVSHAWFTATARDEENKTHTFHERYWGLPVELDFKLFKAEKEQFRILYGLVPIGKPIGFGRSIGIKVFGNISRRSYYGVGVSFGLGWHKAY
ncbi:hypothetical protein [Rufibacter sp. LB8]|uniref:hypothetical protein n=1 Tax=Rufibacter sp. LB8 TaxID=2777781 RepID=UPI00178C82D9|nr:hypothetical protein [Rufibacter sp. LB8]